MADVIYAVTATNFQFRALSSCQEALSALAGGSKIDFAYGLRCGGISILWADPFVTGAVGDSPESPSGEPWLRPLAQVHSAGAVPDQSRIREVSSKGKIHLPERDREARVGPLAKSGWDERRNRVGRAKILATPRRTWK